jgi:hypothetical protein
MSKRKGKPVSFDAMVKFFMQHYNIPTKNDVDKLMARLDQLEALIRTLTAGPYSSRGQIGRRKAALSAVDIVLDVIKRSKSGLGFAEIQAKTAFDEKKIRNIIFRLNKTGKIKRISRGIYVAS